LLRCSFLRNGRKSSGASSALQSRMSLADRACARSASSAKHRLGLDRNLVERSLLRCSSSSPRSSFPRRRESSVFRDGQAKSLDPRLRGDDGAVIGTPDRAPMLCRAELAPLLSKQPPSVIPAKAEIQRLLVTTKRRQGIPAFAGMTARYCLLSCSAASGLKGSGASSALQRLNAAEQAPLYKGSTQRSKLRSTKAVAHGSARCRSSLPRRISLPASAGIAAACVPAPVARMHNRSRGVLLHSISVP